jgi:hypothetical protein
VGNHLTRFLGALAVVVEMAGDFEALVAAGTVVAGMSGIEQAPATVPALDFVVEIVAVATAGSAGLD